MQGRGGLKWRWGGFSCLVINDKEFLTYTQEHTAAPRQVRRENRNWGKQRKGGERSVRLRAEESVLHQEQACLPGVQESLVLLGAAGQGLAEGEALKQRVCGIPSALRHQQRLLLHARSAVKKLPEATAGHSVQDHQPTVLAGFQEVAREGPQKKRESDPAQLG